MIDTARWVEIAQALAVDDIDKTVAELARDLAAAVRQLSFYGVAPLRCGSDAVVGELTCRWWLTLDPPAVWHCHYGVKRHTLHTARGHSIQSLLQQVARAEGLQNPIAQAATLRCLVDLVPQLNGLRDLAARRLRTIPGWEEAIQVIDSFQLARSLTARGIGAEDDDPYGSWEDEAYDVYEEDERDDPYADVPF